jgi:hypothetical protein
MAKKQEKRTTSPVMIDVVVNDAEEDGRHLPQQQVDGAVSEEVSGRYLSQQQVDGAMSEEEIGRYSSLQQVDGAASEEESSLI